MLTCQWHCCWTFKLFTPLSFPCISSALNSDRAVCVEGGLMECASSVSHGGLMECASSVSCVEFVYSLIGRLALPGPGEWVVLGCLLCTSIPH